MPALPQLGLSREEIQRELARRKLRHFVRLLWPIVEPGRLLKWAWYLDAICEHLEAVTAGEIRNLVINIPPRHLKSTLVAIMWTAWEWLHNPSLRYLTSSYVLKLASRDAVRSRRVMLSPQYQMLALKADGEPLFRFAGDQNEKLRYENNATGYRVCTSPDSGTTGEGGDRVLVDDPHNATDVESDAVRTATLEWWDVGMSTRLNDQKTGAKIIIMQRLHEEDLTGHVLAQGGYEHLCLPTLYECDHPHRRTTSIGFTDPRTEEGEILSPDHFGEAEVVEARLRLGTQGFNGQHQQRPTPAGGLIYQRHWFNTYHSLPTKFDIVLQSWDLAFKGKDDRTTRRAEMERVRDPSYVDGTIWGFVGANAYLIDEVRGQWDFAKCIPEVIRLTARYPEAATKLMEDKANGPAMMSVLSDKIPGLLPVDPQGKSKIQRAMAVQPFVEAGNVYLPDRSFAPWILDWLNEICSFPFAKHDDRVDTMSQVLIYMNVNELAAAMRRLEALGKW